MALALLCSNVHLPGKRAEWRNVTPSPSGDVPGCPVEQRSCKNHSSSAYSFGSDTRGKPEECQRFFRIFSTHRPLRPLGRLCPIWQTPTPNLASSGRPWHRRRHWAGASPNSSRLGCSFMSSRSNQTQRNTFWSPFSLFPRASVLLFLGRRTSSPGIARNLKKPTLEVPDVTLPTGAPCFSSTAQGSTPMFASSSGPRGPRPPRSTVGVTEAVFDLVMEELPRRGMNGCSVCCSSSAWFEKQGKHPASKGNSR